MSLLTDINLQIKNEFPIYKKEAERISKECSKKFFEEYALNNIIRKHNKNNIYISFSNNPTEIRNIGKWMVSRFETNNIKSFIINGCHHSSVSNILSSLSKLPKDSVIIFSELSKMQDDTFLNLIQILKEWRNTGCLSYEVLTEKGADTGATTQIRFNNNDYHFLYLEEDKIPRKEYFYLSPEPYGEFFIDHSSYAFMKKISDLYLC